MKSSKLLTSDSLYKAYSKGRQPKLVDSLTQAGIENFYQLFWIFPLRIENIPDVAGFDTIEEGVMFRGRATVVNCQTRPSQIRAKYGKRVPLSHVNLLLKDFHSDKTTIATWFNCYPSQVSKLQSYSEVFFFGHPSSYGGRLQFSNPTLVEESLNDEMVIQYPTVAGINPGHLKKFIHRHLQKIQWDETLPNEIIEKYHFMGIQETFFRFHGLVRSEPHELEKARERLVYQELFDSQIKIFARKSLNYSIKAEKFEFGDSQIEQIKKLFPYQFTGDQNRVTSVISNDFKGGYPLMRLIQGDVGSGKTSVAIVFAALFALKQKQVAVMCPTEALARQHFETFNRILSSQKIEVRLLVGSTPNKDRSEILEGLENGKIKIIIGTHTLFQKTVLFKSLSLAIIDEQHKFGVNQRLSLLKKGKGVHTIIMTATPIPRSLRLTHFGDLEVSTIKEKPGGRKPIQTRVITPAKMEKFLSFVRTRIEIGEQIYIVVPAIGELDTLAESESDSQMQNVHEVYDKFSRLFPDLKVEKLHGQMKADLKNEILNDFYSNKIKLLVSTSVIEVGIDNPNASVMAIINPERFGLSSLHQLRGRVGRGDKPGFCFLVLDQKKSANIMERLKVLESTNDGFEISEQDLRLRGEGDIYGVNQSGTPIHKIAGILENLKTLEEVALDIEYLASKENPLVIKKVEAMSKELLVTHTV